MKHRNRGWRWAARGGVAAVALVTLGAVLQVTGGSPPRRTAAAAAPAAPPSPTAAPPSQASGHDAILAGQKAPAAQHSSAPVTSDPYAPAYHHSYRHGAVPTLATAQKMRSWQSQQPAAQAPAPKKRKKKGKPKKTRKKAAKPASVNELVYGGGVDGIGVTTAAPKVYLVFWGSQWGTAGQNAGGDTTFTPGPASGDPGDPSGEAPYLQEFLKGLGTGGERWSGVMTQYCQGVAKNATSCPAGSAHAGYPSGGALAGVWYDNSSAAPAQADGFDLATEAVKAAAHFGNTTAALNRDAQYVIASPTGTDPDQWLEQGYCAWHDYSGDSTLTGGPAASPYGDIAFTNLPYQANQGQACGQNFVNSGSNGTLDGVSIVEGHEYAETLTDQNPPGGWTYASTNPALAGLENSDLCAWISPGTPGGSADLATATGVFAVQSTWANDDGSKGGCETGHSITGGGTAASAVTVTGPGNQATVLNHPVSLQVTASESGRTSFTYSATGLPPGVSLDPATGAITGTPGKAGSYPVVVAAGDGAGGSGQASFTWAVGAQLLGNPGFEDSATSIQPWTATAGVLAASAAATPARSGHELARLGGKNGRSSSSLAQKVTIGQTWTAATLSFYLDVISNDPRRKNYDTLKVQVLAANGKVLKTLASYSNRTAGGYALHSFPMSAYIGKAVIIRFTGIQTLNKHTTSFLIDDTALATS